MSTDKNSLVLNQSLQNYFLEKLVKVNSQSSVPMPEEILIYLSSVLDKFSQAEKYFETCDGKVREKVLGIKLLESSQFPPEKKKATLKDIGDTSLFLCGFFSDSLNNKIIHQSYYVELGKTAYRTLDGFIPVYYDIPSFYKHVSGSFEILMNMVHILSKELDPSGAFSSYALLHNFNNGQDNKN